MKSGPGACVPEVKKSLFPPHGFRCMFVCSFCSTPPSPYLLSLGNGFGLQFYHSENFQEEKNMLKLCNGKPASEDPLGIFPSPGTWGQAWSGVPLGHAGDPR